uniref:Store-operated calcium entry-associated regulatory factor n=1 Tax=Rhipicephalus microplus TaxID=6941 RepID=A0A6G5A1R8_RHIMP
MSARTFSSRTSLAFSLTVILLLIDPAHPWGGKKVKLKDVEVLTLRQGQYTTGRRSSPVPQLTCLGGSAGCQNAPAVVQCYNRGSDGYSTQWECKADMSKSQKFGTVEVTCEGYDYADDDYILAGSCGLEYRLEKLGMVAAQHTIRISTQRTPTVPSLVQPFKQSSSLLWSRSSSTRYTGLASLRDKWMMLLRPTMTVPRQTIQALQEEEASLAAASLVAVVAEVVACPRLQASDLRIKLMPAVAQLVLPPVV